MRSFWYSVSARGALLAFLASALGACHSAKAPHPSPPIGSASAAATVKIPATPEAGSHRAAPHDAAPGGAAPSASAADAAPAGAASSDTVLHAPHPRTRIEIDLERTACFGSCPVYTLELYGDGTVVFEGKAFVERGIHVAHVPPARVRDLAHGLERDGFFKLSWKKHCGKGHATDLPSAITTLRIGSRKRTIDHYRGDQCAPAILDGWEEHVDKVAGTKRWLRRP